MYFTAKHYYNFGKKLNENNTLISKDGWDAVRCDDNNNIFAIPKTENEFIEKSSQIYNLEAKDIANLIYQRGFKEVFSVGCGCGYLEYNLKKTQNHLKVIATDFNPNAVERLKKVFTICDKIETFNLMEDSYKSEKELLYIFFRLDTELSNKQWMNAFKKMSEDNVMYVLIVAAEFLTFERFLKETIKGILKNVKGYTFCGYIRTKSSFECLWGEYYKIEKKLKVGKLNGYLLKINK